MREIVFYDFDVDASPEMKWNEIINQNINTVMKLSQTIMVRAEDSLPKGIIQNLRRKISGDGTRPYADEISYLSIRFGVSPLTFYAAQLLYEVNCSGICAAIDYPQGKYFFHTVDWSLPTMKDAVIGLNLIKNGKLFGHAVTLLGYLGFLTATCFIYDYTIAVNPKHGLNHKKLIRKYLSSTKIPTGMMIRQIIETQKGFEVAIHTAKHLAITTPSYIFFFSGKYQAQIITRESKKTLDVRDHDLVQADCDYDRISSSNFFTQLRIKVIENARNEIMRLDTGLIENITSVVSTFDMLHMILKNPVKNENTCYVYIRNFEVFDARVP